MMIVVILIISFILKVVRMIGHHDVLKGNVFVSILVEPIVAKEPIVAGRQKRVLHIQILVRQLPVTNVRSPILDQIAC
jgi:hypothetical protein